MAWDTGIWRWLRSQLLPRKAKVAIKTMRKPTPAMVKAFEDTAYGSALNCWEVMIDAALDSSK